MQHPIRSTRHHVISSHRLFVFLLVVFTVITIPGISEAKEDNSVSSFQAGNTWYIKPDGTGDAPTIQAGINLAADGDEVVLADGTFMGVGNRNIDYRGKKITVRSESGDPTSCVIDCADDSLHAHRGFYFHSGEAAGSVLEGVTLARFIIGYALRCENNSAPRIVNCAFVDNRRGYGAYLYYARPEIIDCTFARNARGLYCRESSPTVIGCTFTGNDGQDGGGVYLSNSTASIIRCSFEDNTARGLGGGIYVGNSTCMIDSCTFIGNAASSGGAVACSGLRAELKISNSLMDSNSANENGGCIYGNVSATNGMKLEITGCTITRTMTNTAGGTVYLQNALAKIERTIIAFSRLGSAVSCKLESNGISFLCCDIYGNVNGNWDGYADAWNAGNGNIAADPLFCDLEVGDLTLRNTSPCLPANRPAVGGCGLIGVFGEGCGEATVSVSLDILPGSCPNPFNTTWFDNSDQGVGKDNDKKGGVLPVAVAGSESFDVSSIDPASVHLEGVLPVRFDYEDVTRPAFGGDCACAADGPDGYDDLTLKFSRQVLLVAIGDMDPGRDRVLTLTGALRDGTPFEGSDCVRVPGKDAEVDRGDGARTARLNFATPNPFNPSTTIPFVLPSAMHATLSVFNTEGKLIAVLVHEKLDEGVHNAVWNGTDDAGNPVASGIYYYRLEAGTSVVTRKMTLIK